MFPPFLCCLSRPLGQRPCHSRPRRERVVESQLILFLLMHNVKVDSTPTNRDATSKRIPTHAPLPGNHQTVGMSCPPHVFLKSCSQAEPPEFQGNAGSTMAPDKAMTSTFGDGPRDLCSGLKIPALHDDHDRPSGLAVEPGLPGIAFSGLLPANCRAAGESQLRSACLG